MSFVFDSHRGLIVVLADRRGPSGSAVLRLALDTGATSTVVNVGMLVAIGYDPSVTAERVQVTTGSGVEYVHRIVLQRIDALGQERPNFPILAHTLPPSVSVDGVLGLDLFRDRNLEIDFRAGLVTLS